MNLLAGKLYDPSTSVNKVTTAALAMTALDTTNLRLTFTVPPSGNVFVRLQGIVHGATTFPTILLGVLEGSTVKGRCSPVGGLKTTAVATAMVAQLAEFLVTGLTPGASLTWDAAYGVETLIASTGLKYGGPNNTTANDAFGGFRFEIWDPCPHYTPATGVPPTTTVHQKLDAIDDFVDTEVGAIKAKTDQLTFTTANRVDCQVFGMEAGTVSATAIATGAIDADALAADAGAELADAVWDEALSGHTTAGTAGKALSDAGAGGDPWATLLPGAYGAGTAGNIIGNLVDAVWDELLAGHLGVGSAGLALTTAGALSPLDAAGVRAAVGMASANLDTQLGDLPTAAEIRAEIDANSTKLDAAVSTRLSAAGYTAPNNAGIAAIKAKTDSLTFTVAGKLDVNVLVVNGVTVIGTGAAGDRWRAA